MRNPTTNLTMMDISITDTIYHSKDTENLSHNKKKAKITSDEENKQNNKKFSEKQVNNPKNDKIMITFDDIKDKDNQTSLMRNIEHGFQK